MTISLFSVTLGQLAQEVGGSLSCHSLNVLSEQRSVWALRKDGSRKEKMNSE